LKTPDDLRHHTLITYLTEPYGWSQWFGQIGGSMAPRQETQRFEQMFFALQATQERMGVGLFPLFLVIDELMAGQLCLPFGGLGLRKREYRSFYQSENDNLSAIVDFTSWLADAGNETEQFMHDWAHSMGWEF
jgi:LysR family transcriptional regulator, glycine cleavage system transcriptional activator